MLIAHSEYNGALLIAILIALFTLLYFNFRAGTLEEAKIEIFHKNTIATIIQLI
jgi:hypothetical protein